MQEKIEGISVIVPSYNGETTLPRTLGALSRLSRPDCPVEFILVDNASTDSTPRLMQTFLQAHPGLYLIESRPGRSAALNKALEAASGDLLVFTDDDIIPDPEWLIRFKEAAESNPEYDVFGGQIRLDWPTSPTPWQVRLEAEGLTLGATPIGQPTGPASAAQIKGPNMMVRRKAISGTSGFRTDLGVSTVGPSIAGEETALVRELEARGSKVLFVSEIRVLHIVRPYQMRISSLMRRHCRNGRSMAAIDRSELPQGRFQIFNIPSYIWSYVLKEALKVPFVVFRSRYHAIIKLLDIATNIGAISYLRANEQRSVAFSLKH